VAAAVDLVVFGASGDLTRRKILPSLGRVVSREGQPVRVIGAGRTHQSTADFRAMVKETSQSERLSASAEWVQLDYSDPATFTRLKEQLTGSQTVIFYLATPPETFGDILAGLTLSGLATRADATRRIVVEKPLGHNLPSAHRINAQLAEAFDEEQIFRIDHYLAKDTVQNVLALRFSNSLFEPVWNRTLIETILITVAEDRQARRVLRPDRRGARHHPEPRPAAPRIDHDGAADDVRCRLRSASETSCTPRNAAARSGNGRARTVRGLPG